ncbi:unnamed protein product [Effrenium voratum]|uniref:Uncharacterized protein n=1 Tax=Effrenium voratum TaxID=2562239 RepID=A0AA36JJD1_9DINO|nr:unnamed protein product [Effrenium voratum]CAJ1427802.1 unnamed protein product [Effrenium voratum]
MCARGARLRSASFAARHRRMANGWIQDTAPAAAVLARNKRPLWLVLKKDQETKRQIRNAAFRHMPCMPFDVWLLMKHEEDSAPKAESEEAKQERVRFYRRLGRQRKLLMGQCSRSISPGGSAE